MQDDTNAPRPGTPANPLDAFTVERNLASINAIPRNLLSEGPARLALIRLAQAELFVYALGPENGYRIWFQDKWIEPARFEDFYRRNTILIEAAVRFARLAQ